MSNPYGPPPGGQQNPGQAGGGYGGSGAPSWVPGSGAPAYGPPNQGPPGYGAPVGDPNQGQPAGPPPGYGQPYGQAGPGQAGPGQGGPGQGGSGSGSSGGGLGQWSGPPPMAKTPPDLKKILPLVIGGLGLLSFIFGFLPGLKYGGDQGIDAVTTPVYLMQGFLPILLVLVGLLALAPLVPGGRSYALPTAMLAVAGFLGALATVFTAGSGSSVAKGVGLWLIFIVSVLQTAAAVYAWFTEVGSGRAARPAGERGSAHTARSFGPSQSPAQASPAPAPPMSAYPPHGSGPNVAPSYGGYNPSGYSPAGAPSAPVGNDGPYGRPSEPVPHTGSNPAVDSGSPYSPYGSAPTGPATSGSPEQSGPNTGQHGRDDGPSPDVTQQVRF